VTYKTQANRRSTDEKRDRTIHAFELMPTVPVCDEQLKSPVNPTVYVIV